MADIVVQGLGLEGIANEIIRVAQPNSVSWIGKTVLRLSETTGLEDVPHLARKYQLDWAVLPNAPRWSDFRVLAMDMDSTLITIECIDQLADLAGIGAQVAAITASAMRGDLDFPQALRARVRLLAGLDESALATVYEERLRLSPGAEELLALAKQAGLKTVLVSGGFTYFTHRLQQRLGLDHHLANHLEIVGGKLTGEVLGDIVDAHAKARKVTEVCAGLGCDRSAAIVVGDGANDLEMMAGAGLSVAYRAKPKVQERAMVSINYGGLDAIGHLVR